MSFLNANCSKERNYIGSIKEIVITPIMPIKADSSNCQSFFIRLDTSDLKEIVLKFSSNLVSIY